MSDNDIIKFLKIRMHDLESDKTAITYFDFWIDSEAELNDKFHTELKEECIKLLSSASDQQLLRVAILALATVGDKSNIKLLKSLKCQNKNDLKKAVLASIDEIIFRHLAWHEKIDTVKDQKSFCRFVNAIIRERDKAEQLEKKEPKKYKYVGAYGWENGNISEYLGAALVYFGNKEIKKPTWKNFAEFLYFGKIYE